MSKDSDTIRSNALTSSETGNDDNPDPLTGKDDNGTVRSIKNKESNALGDEDYENHSKRGSLLTSRKFFGWKRETLSCIFGLAGLLAIVGTIYPYNGEPSPQWLDTISLNTLLAIYSVIIKASLILIISSCISQLQWNWFALERALIDVVRHKEAQDGPWGSLQWLWVHKLHQPLTAFAAILMIIAVAIDPFTHQLLTYVDCSVVLDGTIATLPRTNYFVGNGYVIGDNASIGLQALDETIEAGIQASVLAGFFGTPYTPNARVSKRQLHLFKLHDSGLL